MKKNVIFSKKIEPRCIYCEHATAVTLNAQVICPKKGLVREDFSCRHFCYTPLKRTPSKTPQLQSDFDKNDFAI